MCEMILRLPEKASGSIAILENKLASLVKLSDYYPIDSFLGICTRYPTMLINALLMLLGNWLQSSYLSLEE